jgi:phosphoribosylaminoimidazolecarboxamide formyltransferase/IMP cyclohydrolase
LCNSQNLSAAEFSSAAFSFPIEQIVIFMRSSIPLRALVSVSDKTGLESFVKGLVALGYEILSTGGTRKFLEQAGVPVIDVTTYTGFPEIMDGRVKTLHPKVHGAILGRPTLASDAAAIQAHGIIPFQIVVVNLYPFQETVAKPDVSFDEAVENIDIGGPSMVRSASKNHAHVAIVTQPSQYEEVLQQLQSGTMGESFRRRLAAAAFEMTATYDRAISDYMANVVAKESGETSSFGQRLSLTYRLQQELRYGENPHQRAAFYVEDRHPRRHWRVLSS